eukprot:2559481-Rhodomonas_salina.1
MHYYQYRRRPTEADSGTRWCRCCRKMPAYEDFECCSQWCSKVLQTLREQIQAANEGNEEAGAHLRAYTSAVAKYGTGNEDIYVTWLAEVEDACRKKVAVAYEALQHLVQGPSFGEMGKERDWPDRLWEGTEDAVTPGQ